MRYASPGGDERLKATTYKCVGGGIDRTSESIGRPIVPTATAESDQILLRVCKCIGGGTNHTGESFSKSIVPTATAEGDELLLRVCQLGVVHDTEHDRFRTVIALMLREVVNSRELLTAVGAIEGLVVRVERAVVALEVMLATAAMVAQSAHTKVLPGTSVSDRLWPRCVVLLMSVELRRGIRSPTTTTRSHAAGKSRQQSATCTRKKKIILTCGSRSPRRPDRCLCLSRPRPGSWIRQACCGHCRLDARHLLFALLVELQERRLQDL
jgi:hypothetical protein